MPTSRTIPLPRRVDDPAALHEAAGLLKRRILPAWRDGRFLVGCRDESGAVRAVRLRHGLAGHRRPPELSRLAGGVHVIVLEAPSVDRLEYQLELVHRSGATKLIRDPACTRTVPDPFGGKSVIRTDRYRPSVWLGSPQPADRGLIERIRLAPMPDRSRPAWPGEGWIWHAASLDADQPAPLLVFLDGGDYLEYGSAADQLANLVVAGVIPPCRAIFLEPRERMADYSASALTAAHLSHRLEGELARRLPMPERAEHRIGVGASLGGLALLHAHWTRPGFFGGLLLQSGSFFQEGLDAHHDEFRQFERVVRFVAGVLDGSGAAPPVPVHLTCGAGEENLANNRAMAEALRGVGYPAELAETPDAHNWTSFRDALGDGLAQLLGSGGERRG